MAVTILSIDGGGTRGLFPATILSLLEEDLGTSVTKRFDVIIGSATGGIIASTLAAGMSASQIRDIYLNEVKALLPKNFWRQFILLNPLNLFRAKYTNKGLYEALKKHIGAAKTLDDVFQQFGEHPVFLMPSLELNPFLNATEIPSFKPILYNSTSHTDRNTALIDVAMRTSAAAINLPIYQQYAEGGNYANDPCVFGLSFAMSNKADIGQTSRLQNQKLGLGEKPENIKLLSLGCGSDGASYVPEKQLKNPDWGLLKWQRYIIQLVIDSNMVANQYLTKEILPAENYLRINAYYKDEDAPDVLRNKKLRLDVTDQEQLNAIKDYATQTYEKNRIAILNFLQ